jgi:hypothetical protein
MVIRFNRDSYRGHSGIPIKVKVPEDIYNWLLNTASNSKISVSQVVEVLVREYVRTRHE